MSATMQAVETNTTWRSEELGRFKAPEARQGVAVDKNFFYAINNREIAKYRKSDGSKVIGWKDDDGGRIIHLNAGVVTGGKLYVAHSNFPKIPMISSVEIRDPETLKEIGSHSFGETDGSLTWCTPHEGGWYAGFAHYAHHGGMPGRGPDQTRIVKYDAEWHPLKEWKFPKALTDRFTPYSCSCAAFGPGGFLYATGHDAKELYVLEVPADGSVMKWIATVPVNFEGQGFAWDPARDDVLYAISRQGHDVVVVKIISPKTSR